ncbi:MAG: DUF4886 domain-containing protein, partial [Clostridia bacterium]|nr:DUF4886 domain-containing protein [Clostridia bacterium]
IVLGNLYYGGCSLAQHLTFAKKNEAAYQYYKNTAGTWTSTKNCTLETALLDEDWDYISMQETSKTNGLKSSYANVLSGLIDYVRTKNTTAELIWHMTWAYQQDSTHSAFPRYGSSQQKMYEMIVDCTKTCILTEERISLVIPCMTSIQNARTSFLGDTLTRDGYHLDYQIGRYIAGLTWYAAITGASVEHIRYNPAPASITEDMLAVARESVRNAIAEPHAVTLSKLTEGERPTVTVTKDDPSVEHNPADFYETDAKIAQANGVDLSKYTLFNWNHLTNQYWVCTSRATPSSPSSSSSTYQQNVCTERKYSLEEIPLGSIFICDPGWQYRLEIFVKENAAYTGERPPLSRA